MTDTERAIAFARSLRALTADQTEALVHAWAEHLASVAWWDGRRTAVALGLLSPITSAERITACAGGEVTHAMVSLKEARRLRPSSADVRPELAPTLEQLFWGEPAMEASHWIGLAIWDAARYPIPLYVYGSGVIAVGQFCARLAAEAIQVRAALPPEDFSILTRPFVAIGIELR